MEASAGPNAGHPGLPWAVLAAPVSCGQLLQCARLLPPCRPAADRWPHGRPRPGKTPEVRPQATRVAFVWSRQSHCLPAAASPPLTVASWLAACPARCNEPPHRVLLLLVCATAVYPELALILHPLALSVDWSTYELGWLHPPSAPARAMASRASVHRTAHSELPRFLCCPARLPQRPQRELRQHQPVPARRSGGPDAAQPVKGELLVC